MPAPSTTIFTADFRRAFAQETASLLRARFLWFTAIVGGISILNAGVGMLVLGNLPGVPEAGGRSSTPDLWISQGLQLLVGLVFLGAFAIEKRRDLPDARLLGATCWLLVLQGSVNILIAYLFSPAIEGAMPTWGRALFAIVVTHTLACAFLPWSLRQSLRPMLWLVILNAVFLVGVSDLPPAQRVVVLFLSPLAALPGAIVSWARTLRRAEKSKMRFLQSRYGEVRRELVDARKVHEGLFPPSIEAGPIRMRYAYEPMRQIGGDFLFSRAAPDASLTLVLADVTGHGIPAALTVNRLFGELERLIAERPDTPPGDLLRSLNRYVHLTLAPHSIYLTAFCARVDGPRNTLEFASAGHPPAFLRTVDGRLEDLPSTTFVLGAVPAEIFDSAPQTRPFALGDALILYTDGAIECRDASDAMFGIARLRALIAGDARARTGEWSRNILRAVEAFRDGPPKDDTLVVEVYRPL